MHTAVYLQCVLCHWNNVWDSRHKVEIWGTSCFCALSSCLPPYVKMHWQVCDLHLLWDLSCKLSIYICLHVLQMCLVFYFYLLAGKSFFFYYTDLQRYLGFHYVDALCQYNDSKASIVCYSIMKLSKQSSCPNTVCLFALATANCAGGGGAHFVLLLSALCSLLLFKNTQREHSLNLTFYNRKT